jgi:hypothetical protein
MRVFLENRAAPRFFPSWTSEGNAMDTPQRWPQSYEEYAGFNTEIMRRRARDAGCDEDEIDLWLHVHYGKDNWLLSPVAGLYRKWKRSGKKLKGVRFSATAPKPQ